MKASQEPFCPVVSCLGLLLGLQESNFLFFEKDFDGDASTRQTGPPVSSEIRGNWMMKGEYDFSKGVRGKFYRKGAELSLPIYLDAKLQAQIERLAQKKG